MGGPCVVDGVSRPELDNFYQCNFTFDGKTWPTSEHCYQASKYPDDDEKQEEIRAAACGMDSWKAGNSSREEATLREDWEVVKVYIMYRANFAKFSQNRHLRQLLVESKGPITAQGGLYWKTWNEILLERIREELKDFDCCDRRLLRARCDMMDALRAAAQAKNERQILAVTTWASQRKLPPPAEKLAASRLRLSCKTETLPWLTDPAFQLDSLAPEVNGQPHYVNTDGLHLYYGKKGSRRAWCIDEFLSADEVCGQAFIEVLDGSPVPIKENTWQCFDGSKHESRQLILCA